MSAEEADRQCVPQSWSATTRYAVVTSTLRVPGRGQSATGSNRGGWKTEDRQAVLNRLEQLAAELVGGLASNAVSIDQARAGVTDAGFDGAIRVATSAEELAAQLAEVMRSGDNVWVDCSQDDGGVAYLKFWHDPSHP